MTPWGVRECRVMLCKYWTLVQLGCVRGMLHTGRHPCRSRHEGCWARVSWQAVNGGLVSECMGAKSTPPVHPRVSSRSSPSHLWLLWALLPTTDGRSWRFVGGAWERLEMGGWDAAAALRSRCLSRQSVPTNKTSPMPQRPRSPSLPVPSKSIAHLPVSSQQACQPVACHRYPFVACPRHPGCRCCLWHLLFSVDARGFPLVITTA